MENSLLSSVTEPSTDESTAAEQTVRITHLVDQREAIPSPHPSMHLGAEHKAAKGEFNQEGGTEFSLIVRYTS